jgi:hypothetical protein
MITNRHRDGELFNSKRGPLTYWVADDGDPTVLSTWRKVSATVFETLTRDMQLADPKHPELAAKATRDLIVETGKKSRARKTNRRRFRLIGEPLLVPRRSNASWLTLSRED